MKKLYDPMPDLDRSECTPDLFSDPVKLLHCYMVKICDCSTIDEFVRLKGIIDKGIVSRWSSWKMGKSIPSKTTIEKIMAGDPEWAGRALSVFDQLKEDSKHSRETESIPVKGPGPTVPVVSARKERKTSEPFDVQSVKGHRRHGKHVPIGMTVPSFGMSGIYMYKKDMNLTEEEFGIIENALSILFDKETRTVFRYAAAPMSARYTYIGDAIEKIDDYRSRAHSYPRGSNEEHKEIQKSIRHIFDRFLAYMGTWRYEDIESSVRKFLRMRKRDEKYDLSEINEDELREATGEAREELMQKYQKYLKEHRRNEDDYREHLRLARPDLSSWMGCELEPFCEITLGELYRMCRIAADPKDNILVRAYDEGNTGVLDGEESFRFDDTFNRCPGLANWGYCEMDHAHDRYFPRSADVMIRKLVSKTMHKRRATVTKSGLLFSKKIPATMYEVRLHIKKKGMEFIKWYERLYGTPDELKQKTPGVHDALDAINDERENYMRNVIRKPIGLFGRKFPEYGGRWGDIKKFEKDFAYPMGKSGHAEPEEGSNDMGNLILSENVFFDMNRLKTHMADNVFLIGDTGTGKVRYYTKPNILQQNTSYVVIDTSSEIYTDMGDGLRDAGYDIKLFDVTEPESSCGYNPFDYISNPSDIFVLSDCIIRNTSNGGTGDIFFEHASRALIEALIGYTCYRVSPKYRNMAYLLELLKKGNKNPMNPDAKTELDLLFEEYEKDDPTATPVISYKSFCIGGGKTKQAVMITTMIRLQIFSLDNVKKVTAKDTIHLEELGDHKQALFIKLPQQDTSYRPIFSMLCSQIFMAMYGNASNGPERFYLKWDGSSPIKSKEKSFSSVAEIKAAEKEFKARVAMYRDAEIGLADGTSSYCIKSKDGEILTIGTEEGRPAVFDTKEQAEYFMKCIRNGKIERGTIRLTSHVHLIMDEFANIGYIPNIDELMATMCKYGISSTIMVQSVKQLRDVYDEDMSATIFGNCGIKLLFGTRDADDAELMSEMLGKMSPTGKGDKEEIWLMLPDEIMKMDTESCIVSIRSGSVNVNLLDRKYDPCKHLNYRKR